MGDADPLRCAACRHEIAYDDAVHTVGGRRFHAACVDAHQGETSARGVVLGVFARWIDRYASVLRR